MMESSEAIQPLKIDDLAPADSEDLSRRALFFCHCLFLYSKRSLNLLISKCRSGELGEEARALDATLTEWKLESCNKLLTCAGLHMVGLDHSNEDPPPWVVQFFAEAAGECDEIFPTPSALDVIERHGGWKRDRMLAGIGDHAREILQCEDTSKILRDKIGQFLHDSAEYRSELLLFALSQPQEALLRHLETLE